MKKKNVPNEPCNVYIDMHDVYWGFVKEEAQIIKLNKEDVSFHKVNEDIELCQEQ